MQIIITIPKSVPARLWQKVANHQARLKADIMGIPWIDAEVLVILPENGRAMTKHPGYTQLIAHG